jgi:hypothetical protein
MISCLEQCLQLKQSNLGADHPEVGITLMRLAYAHRELAHVEDDIRLLQNALSIFHQKQDYPHVIQAVAQLHSILASQRQEEISALRDRSLRIALELKEQGNQFIK